MSDVSTGDFDGALKLHWSHLNICKQMNDIAGICIAYGNIGNVYSGLKQFEEAIKYHKLELQISKKVHRKAEASAHGNLAKSYQELAFYQQALTHHLSHLSLAKEIKGDVTSKANALCNLGNYHCIRKEFDIAVNYYEQFIECTRSIDDKESEAEANNLIGFAYYSMSNHHQKALQHFELDLALSKEIQDRKGIGRAYYHLGLVKAALCLLDEALQCFKSSCAAQDDASKLRAMGKMADVLTRQGKYNEAMRLLEKQLTLSRNLGNVEREAQVFASLGSCQKAAGKFEEAAQFFKEELGFRQGVQDIVAVITALGMYSVQFLQLRANTTRTKKSSS